MREAANLRSVMKNRLLFAGTILLVAACGPAAESLPVPDRIEAGEIEPTAHRLQNLALAPAGFVLGSEGAELHRIADGQRTELLHRFDDPIVGIHAAPRGQLVVSTDRDYRDPATPCRVYLSTDGGRTFVTTKEILGGCPIWWSMASNARGDIYLGEYGPKAAEFAKTVWKSTDGGMNWAAAFQAPTRDGLHIHRVAVDPHTQDVWITTGDGSDNRGVYRSRDGSAHFERLFDSQATGIAFTPEAIYFGEDHNKKGRISRVTRGAKDYREVFRAGDRGGYGGSVYDMAVGRSGRVYATLVKYPDQNHIASVWAGRDGDWTLLLRLASTPGGASGSTSIAGPDRDGWIYLSGFRIRDQSGAE